MKTKHKQLEKADTLKVGEMFTFPSKNWKGTQRMEIYLRAGMPKKKFSKRDFNGTIYVIRIA